MSSILNSISSGDLQVQQTPKETPVKENSIMELLQNSEIEFSTCPKLKEDLEEFNTGFGENNDLHYETNCKLPELKTPLYQENYLSEFITEEEKAAARHALGLYNKGDVVAMSLLTTESKLPTTQELNNAVIKQMRQGDVFFTPITQFKAVLDSSGISLETRFKEVQKTLNNHQKEIIKITEISTNKEITSLGDVGAFLQGFENGSTLKESLEEFIKFEKTGQII